MHRSCQLVADIGGTNARFACLNEGNTALSHIVTLQCADHPTPLAAIRTYLATLPEQPVRKLCMALAGPVQKDHIQLTNNHWQFSRSELSRTLGFPVSTINDFSAQALCLDELTGTELVWFGTPRPAGGHMRIVLGPGTGLGVAGLHPGGAVLPSEGGHISYAPVDEHGMDILRLLWRRYPRLSIERVLSGPGLANLYWANSILAGAERELAAPAITDGALVGEPLCVQTINDFLDLLAAAAGDFALVMGATDGVYLSGGILPRLGPLFDHGRFRRLFQNKGRFEGYCAELPLAMVSAEHTGLRGCAGALRKGLA